MLKIWINDCGDQEKFLQTPLCKGEILTWMWGHLQVTKYNRDPVIGGAPIEVVGLPPQAYAMQPNAMLVGHPTGV